MNKIMFALAVVSVFGVAGCKKKGAADMSGKYTEFKDNMCKCKAGDSACAQKVSDDMTKWAAEQAKTMGTEAAKMDPKEAEEMAKTITPIMTEYTKCMTAAMTPAAAGGDKPPPAGGSAGSAAAAGPPSKEEALSACTLKLTGKVKPKESEMTKEGLEYSLTNNSKREVQFCQLNLFAYDKAGEQAAFSQLSDNPYLKPGETKSTEYSRLEIEKDGKSLASEPGYTFEAVVSSVKFVDGGAWDDKDFSTTRPKGGKK